MTQRHVVAYLRVSTKNQDTANQRLVLDKWIAENGHKLVAVYEEQESAWRQGHQRELSRLVRELPKRKVDTLWCWSLDRLTRQGGGTLAQMIADFNKRGVDVVTNQESWLDQEGWARDLLILVWGYMAQYESGRISRRVLAGLDRAKAKGKALGRPKGSKDRKRRRRSGYFARYADPKITGDGADEGVNGNDGNDQTTR